MPTVTGVKRRARVWWERVDAHRFVRSIPDIRDLTMVGQASLVEVVQFVDLIVSENVPGDVVECGVWRGGASFTAARRLQHHGDQRTVWMFDSFEGLPSPEEIDGPSAKAWARDPDGPKYYDNCKASVDLVRTDAERLGVSAQVRIVEGWFDETLPATKQVVGAISFLRIDADWHASVRRCLEELYDQLSPGGIVLFDDYYTWDGCAVAVHEFLGERSLACRLIPGDKGTYFRKPLGVTAAQESVRAL